MSYPADEMTVWPISPRVNSPKNNEFDSDVLGFIRCGLQYRYQG